MKTYAYIILLFGLTASAHAQIDISPADPDANEATRALYTYLKDEVWGKQVLSGCQAEWNYNTNDAEKIKSASGKYPAINVFDFQHFDQTWISYRTNTAKSWHDAGGIVGFMWHIHMPSNAFAEHKSGWEGFYTYGSIPCHISPSKAATDGTIENRIFKKKLDGVVSLLQLYQRQGIPILWRPLHEASGKWFWWGSEDGAAYKQLYIYMFDYFRASGIHNLLWIWTSELNDEDWYPGDEYVDIIARDGYPSGNRTHISQSADFKKLQKTHPNKMIAMPECNSVPSWDNMEKDGARWLFVAPWCGGGAFDHGNTNDFWKSFLNNDHVISRDKVRKGL
jgi:mannan endo-1,4-beta-mannosidase